MMRHLLILLLLLPTLAGCLASGGVTTVAVHGRVTLDRQPLAGVEVTAWPESVTHFDGSAPYRTELTGADGRFQMTLPPGGYYFFARGESVFAYYGRNPVAIAATGSDDLNIGLVRTVSESATPMDGVSGQVTLDGTPVEGAVIFAYTDLGSQLKGMGYLMSAPTDADGRFNLQLEDGTYYLLARKRQGRSGMGPLRAGDLVGYAPDNPLKVRSGQAPPLTIPLLQVPEKVDRMQDSLFGSTRISGRIVDANGKPIAGVRAVIYDRPQMLDRPLYVSQPTGSDGRYVISLPQGGVYFLAARNTLGGAPAPGDLYGTYNRDPEHKLQVESGSVHNGIDMVVEKMW